MEKQKWGNAIWSCCRVITIIVLGGWQAEPPSTAGMEMSWLPHAKFYEPIYVPTLRSELDEEGGSYTVGAFEEEKPKPSQRDSENAGPRPVGITSRVEATGRTAHYCHISCKSCGRVRRARYEVGRKISWSTKESGDPSASTHANRKHERVYRTSYQKARCDRSPNRRAPGRERPNATRSYRRKGTTCDLRGRSCNNAPREASNRKRIFGSIQGFRRCSPDVDGSNARFARVIAGTGYRSCHGGGRVFAYTSTIQGLRGECVRQRRERRRRRPNDGVRRRKFGRETPRDCAAVKGEEDSYSLIGSLLAFCKDFGNAGNQQETTMCEKITCKVELFLQYLVYYGSW